MVAIVDGSVDVRTIKFLDQIPQMYDQSKLILARFDESRGMAEAGNTALQIAFEQKADFIAWMEPEATSVEERFETQINFMKQNPYIDIVGSNLIVFNESYGLSSVANGKVVSYPTQD